MLRRHFAPPRKEREVAEARWKKLRSPGRSDHTEFNKRKRSDCVHHSGCWAGFRLSGLRRAIGQNGHFPSIGHLSRLLLVFQSARTNNPAFSVILLGPAIVGATETIAMTQIPEVEGWADATASKLYEAADAVSAAAVPECLGVARLRFATLAEEAEQAINCLAGRIDRDRCLYTITLDDDADREAVKSAFRGVKQSGELKLPQDNGVMSDTLYVGSSCATKKRKSTLRNRLRQHLIKAPNGTYALSLAEWTGNLDGGIIVKAWQYPSLGNGPEPDAAARRIVLSIEDWLAGEVTPMLGRRGSRH